MFKQHFKNCLNLQQLMNYKHQLRILKHYYLINHNKYLDYLDRKKY